MKRMSRRAWRLSCVAIGLAACSRPGSVHGRTAAIAAELAVRPGMSVATVVDIAAAQNRPFTILRSCGSEGSLNVGGNGGDAGLWAARGSPSGDGAAEHHFVNRAQLKAALTTFLLKDGPCSRLLVGFPGEGSSRFDVLLNGDGLVEHVGPTESW